MFYSKKIYFFSCFTLLLSIHAVAEIALQELDFKQDLEDLSVHQIPYSATYGKMALMSGWIEHLRFFGAFRTHINHENPEGVERRNFQDDEPLDKTSALVKSFFRSQSGTLSVTDRPYEAPVAYLNIPDLIFILHWVFQYRQGLLEDPTQAKTNLIHALSEQIAPSDATTSSPWMQAVHFALNKRNPAEQKKQAAKRAKLKADLGFLLDQVIGALDEEVSEKKPQGIYPQFTVEAILTAFFVKKFSAEDLPTWRSELKISNLNRSTEKSDPITLALKNWMERRIEEFQNRIEAPYQLGETFVGNANVPAFQRATGRFLEGRMLADCAETTLRHFFNILLYRHVQPLQEGPIEIRGQFDLSALLAVDRGFSGEKALPQAWKNFFKTQTPELARQGSLPLRRAWLEVVSDWPGLRYNQGHDLDTGFLNGMRALAYLSGRSLDPLPKKEDLTKENLEAWLLLQLEKWTTGVAPWKKVTFRLEHSKYQLVKTGEPELYGDLQVSIQSLEDSRAQDFQVSIFMSPSHVKTMNLMTTTVASTQQNTQKRKEEAQFLSQLPAWSVFFDRSFPTVSSERLSGNREPVSRILEFFSERDPGSPGWLRKMLAFAQKKPFPHLFERVKNVLESSTFLETDTQLNQQILFAWGAFRKYFPERKEVLRHSFLPSITSFTLVESSGFLEDVEEKIRKKILHKKVTEEAEGQFFSSLDDLSLLLTDCPNLSQVKLIFPVSSIGHDHALFLPLMQAYLPQLLAVLNQHHATRLQIALIARTEDGSTVPYLNLLLKAAGFKDIQLNLLNYGQLVEGDEFLKTASFMGIHAESFLDVSLPLEIFPSLQKDSSLLKTIIVHLFFFNCCQESFSTFKESYRVLKNILKLFETHPALETVQIYSGRSWLPIYDHLLTSLPGQLKEQTRFSLFTLSRDMVRSLQKELTTSFIWDQSNFEMKPFVFPDADSLASSQGIEDPKKIIELSLGEHGKLSNIADLPELFPRLEKLDLGSSLDSLNPEHPEQWRVVFQLFDGLPNLKTLSWTGPSWHSQAKHPQLLVECLNKKNFLFQGLHCDDALKYRLTREQFQKNRDFLLFSYKNNHSLSDLLSQDWNL